MEILCPEKTPRGAVLVFHSWWGLTPSFRDYGKRLAGAGVLVGLADLFGGRTAETPDEARALRSAKRRQPMYKTLADDIARLRDRGGERIGVVGFSMGGHWAVWLSQRPDYGIAATVLYYAARGGDFTACKAGILAHFAEQDDWVSRSSRANMERAIGRAGCTYRAFDYPGTGHWFAESARRDFNPEAAGLALDRDVAHLVQGLSA